MEDAGGTSNTSFCSNSACHGNVFTYAGFDAPALREVLQSQLPPPVPTPTAGPAPENPTYAANVAEVFEPTCTACHNATVLAGGMDLTSYASLMKGAKDGAVIVPGNSENSLLISVQSAKHFANLTAAQLELVREWIEGGRAGELAARGRRAATHYVTMKKRADPDGSALCLSLAGHGYVGTGAAMGWGTGSVLSTAMR